MNPIDDLRGAYNAFLKSPAGKDLLTRILAYEGDLTITNYRLDTSKEQKLVNIDKASGLYWVRTLLHDLSQPKPTPAPRVGRTPRPGAKS